MKKRLLITDISADATKVANIASAGIGVGTSVFSVISNIQDNKQRALFEANFKALSADQQRKLDQQVSTATSQSEKLRIIADTLTKLSIARITTQAGLISEEEKKKRNQMIVVGGIMIATGLIITLIIIKKY